MPKSASDRFYFDNCPLCRAQKQADREGRKVRMRDFISASRGRDKKS